MAEQQRGGGPGAAPRGGYQKPKNIKRTVRRLMDYVTRRKAPLIAVLILLLFSVGTNITGSYYSSRVVINHLVDGVYSGDASRLGIDLLILLAVYAVSALCTYGQSAIMVRLAQRGIRRLRQDLFDKLQELPLAYFDRHTHGELMSRFTNDADNVQMAMEQSLITLFSSALMFVGIVVVMVVVNPLLFLVTVLTLGSTFFVFKIFGGRSRTSFQKQQAALGALNGNIQEIIEGLRVVKAFTHEEQAKTEFGGLNVTYRDAAMGANFFSSAIMPISMNIMNIGYALTAAFGGLLAVLTGFDLGGLVLYLNLSRQVGQPMNQISQQITTILSALAGAERIFAIMDETGEADEGKVTLVVTHEDTDGTISKGTDNRRPRSWAWQVPGPDGTFTLVPLKGSVRLIDVNFSYVEGKPVLQNVSVYAKPGQKIAFVGSTGAGKTTITNLINRFYEIDSGTITYDGIDVRDIEKDSLRRSMGMVLQDTHLFTGTVMDNIRYGRLDATDEECVAAAKSANAHSFIRRLPQGYQTMVTGDGANLSQGQRQLLAIARAAVADPPVMVLDEATSSIDTHTERLIEKGMDALMVGRTVFVIAHRLSTVRNSNAIMVIEHGKIIERGDHADLLGQHGRYYQLYTGQFELE
ncbi:putative ABC transporter ATP-binding protein [bioreactor metagenome]|uniref:Putative ABC transporter ATP-binding protein n=1 Tax=bioreactor metagenome TaxID=1076179 RepID=A0A644XGT6_9ZZZZ